jgi:hypothetical protein
MPVFHAIVAYATPFPIHLDWAAAFAKNAAVRAIWMILRFYIMEIVRLRETYVLTTLHAEICHINLQ